MKTLARLPEDIREQVCHRLIPGEEPIWCAQPLPTLVNRLTIPSLFFSLFGLFFSALVYVVGGVAMLPFLALLVGVPVAFVFIIRHRMRRTVYLLTEQRALVLRPAGRRKSWQLYSWPLEAGLLKECVLHSDGSGDIILGYEKNRTDRESQSFPMGFFNVPDARRVEMLIMSATSAPSDKL